MTDGTKRGLLLIHGRGFKPAADRYLDIAVADLAAAGSAPEGEGRPRRHRDDELGPRRSRLQSTQHGLEH